jgi:hypothetical protein
MTANSTTPCYYHDLPEGNWTRRLRLLPGKEDSPLACEIFPANINDAPAFEAISYVWGDPRDTTPIICSKAPLDITISLNDIFRTLRYPWDVKLVWEDAICIDQRNLRERGHQVGMMATIYRRASRVSLARPRHHGDAGDAFVLISKTNRYFGDGVAKFGTLNNITAPPAESEIMNYANWTPVRRISSSSGSLASGSGRKSDSRPLKPLFMGPSRSTRARSSRSSFSGKASRI